VIVDYLRFGPIVGLPQTNGRGAFRSHRERTLAEFKNVGVTAGVALYQTEPEPKERFTEDEKPFVQDSLFFWLTGWDDPDCGILIDLDTAQSTLLLPDRTDEYELYNGARPATAEIIAQTGVDAVTTLKSLPELLAARSPSMIYATPFPIDVTGFPVDREVLLVATATARRLKSAQEVAALRTASHLTGQAIIDLLRWFRWHEGMTESDVQAYFEFRGRMLGCRTVAFPTIVGAGANATILHGKKGASPIARGDLILLDCGLSFGHYAGDITRTFPASGKFSPEQATVYGALLAAQKSLINAFVYLSVFLSGHPLFKLQCLDRNSRRTDSTRRTAPSGARSCWCPAGVNRRPGSS
jgi:Xaa-Pro aminopeptidase